MYANRRELDTTGVKKKQGVDLKQKNNIWKTGRKRFVGYVSERRRRRADLYRNENNY